MRFLQIIALIISAVTLSTAEELRTWNSADGKSKFSARFTKRSKTHVTVTQSDGKSYVFPIAQLSKADQKWIFDHQSRGVNSQKSFTGDVFDKLRFGDDRTTVTKKLRASKLVEPREGGIFLNSAGLNGVYRTRNSIGGLKCYLHFGWSAEGELLRIDLQTKGFPVSEYESKLRPCWTELGELLSALHGRPYSAGAMVPSNALQDGQILGSHIWNGDQGGSITLGSARDDENYRVIVRFNRNSP